MESPHLVERAALTYIALGGACERRQGRTLADLEGALRAERGVNSGQSGGAEDRQPRAGYRDAVEEAVATIGSHSGHHMLRSALELSKIPPDGPGRPCVPRRHQANRKPVGARGVAWREVLRGDVVGRQPSRRRGQ